MRLRASTSLPYDMFDAEYTASEARRAKRMESIYHVGQDRVWEGRKVLAELVEKHGRPQVDPAKRHALSRVFGLIMWGELAAWKVSAQLANQLVPLEAKLAATAQVHDEARHFYVMHDYLALLGCEPKPLAKWDRKVIEMTLATDNVIKKLLGMQLTIETIALVIFQRVREIKPEPVLTELLTYFERDEARHVGLGMQMLPPLMMRMRIPEAIDLGVFQLRLLVSALLGLKAIEDDLIEIGVDPRSVLTLGFKKQMEMNDAIRAEIPNWPEDSPVRRVFEATSELMFPTAGRTANISIPLRIKHAIDVARRLRPSVQEVWNAKKGAK